MPSIYLVVLLYVKVEAIVGRNDEAIMNFEKVIEVVTMCKSRSFFIYVLKLKVSQVRSIDPYVVTYMDEYAMLLKAKSDHSKLSKLVHDLLNIDPARAETSVALAVLWERKNERRALSYAERVRYIIVQTLLLFSFLVF